MHNRSLNGVVEFMRRKTISIAGKIQSTQLFTKLHASSPLEALACNISFQMVTGAVLGFIDVKRGKDMEATYSAMPSIDDITFSCID